jgi:hypothetical protein
MVVFKISRVPVVFGPSNANGQGPHVEIRLRGELREHETFYIRDTVGIIQKRELIRFDDLEQKRKRAKEICEGKVGREK